MDELEITPKDVKTRLDRGEKLHLVDVREPWEYDLCRIEGAKLVPLGSLAASLQTLPDVDEVICYCHHGMRSLDAAAWLRFQGIERAKSLAGGIERWSLEVDPNVLYTGTQHLWRTTNQGQTWDRISPDLTRHDPKTMGDSGGPITHDMNSPEVYATVCRN